MKKWITVLMTAVMLALTGSFAVMAEDETEGENGGTVTVTAPSLKHKRTDCGKNHTVNYRHQRGFKQCIRAPVSL